MQADKVPTIVESSLTNDGKRTLVISDLAVGAQAPPHYHTDFSETFELVSGGITVFMSPDMKEENLVPIKLEVGKPVTVPKNTLHSFIIPDETTHVKAIFEPGSIGFEKTLLIMRGTQEDGSYKQFSSLESDDGAMFYAILGELTNTIFVGQAQERLDALYAAKGAEIEAKKEELIERYASDEILRKVAGL